MCFGVFLDYYDIICNNYIVRVVVALTCDNTMLPVFLSFRLLNAELCNVFVAGISL